MTIKLFISKLLVFSIFLASITWGISSISLLKNNLKTNSLLSLMHEVDNQNCHHEDSETFEFEMDFIQRNENISHLSLFQFSFHNFVSLVNLESQFVDLLEIKPPSHLIS
jgi:hypothetical protein